MSEQEKPGFFSRCWDSLKLSLSPEVLIPGVVITTASIALQKGVQMGVSKAAGAVKNNNGTSQAPSKIRAAK